jgi:glucokinase
MMAKRTITPFSNAQPPFYWGVDIGGTGIKFGLVDDHGQTLAYERVKTQERAGPQAAVVQIAEIISRHEAALEIEEHRAVIGIGAPGPMNLRDGCLVAPPQLPSWWGFPIRDAVAESLGRSATLLNDANAAAFGEHWLGSGRDADSMILLTLGTGVGGGVIVDGELVNGQNSCGSECGHIIVDPSPTAELCVWGGGRGHLEAYASASAVVHRTRQRLLAGANSVLNGSVTDDDNELTAKKVHEAALADDKLALEMVDETARWLGIGITTLVHTIDPGSVVLGGAMDFGGANCRVGQQFLQSISHEFKKRTFDYVFSGTTIGFATLGGDAGYLGAAGYARRESHKTTS